MNPSQQVPNGGITNPMPVNPTEQSAVVAVYATHTHADAAIRALHATGFNMRNLSIIGRDVHSEEHAVGFYNIGERMTFWGGLGAFWGGLWGLLFGGALFFIPAIGPLVVMGPLVGWMVGALEGAAVGGSVGVLGAALVSAGMPKDSIVRYQNEVKAGKFLVLAHGSASEIQRAQSILGTNAAQVATHSN